MIEHRAAQCLLLLAWKVECSERLMLENVNFLMLVLDACSNMRLGNIHQTLWVVICCNIFYEIHFVCSIEDKGLPSEWSNIEPLDAWSCSLGELSARTIRCSKTWCSLMLGLGKSRKVMLESDQCVEKLGSIIHY